jgi:hypothetical protein
VDLPLALNWDQLAIAPEVAAPSHPHREKMTLTWKLENFHLQGHALKNLEDSLVGH